MAGNMLSIIIPVYNVEEYLERCLNSCKVFLDKGVEIILVDDGSTDSSSIICDKYASEKIKVIHKVNGGLSDARNQGLKIATGEYIWFVDSDDLIFPIYDSLVKCFKEAPDIISLNYQMSINDKTIDMVHGFGKNYTIYTGVDYLKQVLKSHTYFVPVWTYIYRREYFVSNNYEFRKGIYHEDEQITPYLLLNAKTIMSLDKIGYKYIVRMNSIVTNKSSTKNVKDLFYIYKENSEYFNNNITDTVLKQLLLNNIAEKIMYICSRYNVSNHQIKDLYDLKLIYQYSLGSKNKIKALLFMYIRPVYTLIYKINEKRKVM